MARLTGKITDVTSKAPENISSITVKAPAARVGGGTDVIVSSPATVDFNRDTGDITISNLTGGLSWLYIEGDGWTDSIALSVAEGMITLVEAIANASGIPGLVDFIALLTDLQNRIDSIAQDAVDAAAAQYVGVKNIGSQHLDDVRTPGRYAQPLVENATVAQGYPVAGERVNLFVVPIHETSSSQVMQHLVVISTGDIYVRSYVGSWGEWSRSNSGVVNLGTAHLDDILTPGYYAQPISGNVTKAKGYPVVGARVTLKVERIHGTSATQVAQTVTSVTTGKTFMRTVVGGNYSEWYKVGGEPFFRGVVTGATHDEITDWTAPGASGAWTVTNRNNATAMGLPEEATARGSLFNLTDGNKGAEIRHRIFITTDGELWTQYATSSGYTAWTKKETSNSTPTTIEGGGGGGAVTAYDTMLRGRGRIGTGGRPVVAFRFDHSAKPFIEKVLPVLKQYGLPATLPCFVDMMDPQPGYTSDISTGYTWNDVQECFYNGVEVFSHSWSHQDATTVEGIEKEIRESRFTLEENMPDLLVHGWANPGVPNAYNGYWGGDSTHHVKMGLNYAGQLITNTYGCFNTNKSGVTQLGSQDLAHRTIESITSLDTVKSRVNDAVLTSSAAVLMLHPNQLDANNRMSLALFDEVCAWVASERDAGRLDVLTMSGVALADPSSDWRHDLTPALSAWSKSGDTYSVQVPVYFVPFAGGSTRQVRVVCSQATSVSVRVRATGAPMDVSQTVQASAGVPVFVPVGIPRRATDIEVTVTGAGVQDIRLESV